MDAIIAGMLECLPHDARPGAYREYSLFLDSAYVGELQVMRIRPQGSGLHLGEAWSGWVGSVWEPARPGEMWGRYGEVAEGHGREVLPALLEALTARHGAVPEAAR